MVKVFALGCAALMFSFTIVSAEPMNKTDNGNGKGPGTVGAMQNAPSAGIAIDPGQVQAQQGRTAKSSPGTVGAAPGANTPSQHPTR